MKMVIRWRLSMVYQPTKIIRHLQFRYNYRDAPIIIIYHTYGLNSLVTDPLTFFFLFEIKYSCLTFCT